MSPMGIQAVRKGEEEPRRKISIHFIRYELHGFVEWSSHRTVIMHPCAEAVRDVVSDPGLVSSGTIQKGDELSLIQTRRRQLRLRDGSCGVGRFLETAVLEDGMSRLLVIHQAPCNKQLLALPYPRLPCPDLESLQVLSSLRNTKVHPTGQPDRRRGTCIEPGVAQNKSPCCKTANIPVLPGSTLSPCGTLS